MRIDTITKTALSFMIHAAGILYISALVSNAFGFGQNKVHYEKLKWWYNKTPHYLSFFHQNQGELSLITAHWAEDIYFKLSNNFSFKLSKPIPLIVFANPIFFEQTNVTPEIIPEGVGGFTEMLKNRVVIPFSGSYEEFRHVLNHELVHAFEFGILFDQFSTPFLRTSAIQMPLWFAEGLAEYLSLGWNCESDMFLMDRTIFSEVPFLTPDLQDYMVYKGGQSFFHFLAISRGDSLFHKFLVSFSKSRRVEESIELIYKKDMEALNEEWIRELKRIYWPEIGKRENLALKCTPLSSHEKKRSNFNLKPRISPNGSRIAFYSDAHDFTKIFIVDTKGKVVMTIGQYGYGGYFEAFQPFRSGMCWSPQSDKLAFVTKNKGKNEIRIIDIKKRKLVQTLRFNMTSICSPDWSSDGKMITFCGLKEHCSDLYLYNLETKKINQLTNDIRYESDPRFSKDGLAIIFAGIDSCGGGCHWKERPSSELYLLSLKDNTVKQLTTTPWNETQPCFSSDSENIAFVSDRNGINNIYIGKLSAPDSAKALTDIIGGCSNPDWCRNNAMVFSLFQKQGWDIWYVEEPMKKLFDSLPSPTLWVKSLQDTAVRFFVPVKVPLDTVKKKKDTTKAASASHQAAPAVRSTSSQSEESGSIEEINTEKTEKKADSTENSDSVKALSTLRDSTKKTVIRFDTPDTTSIAAKDTIKPAATGQRDAAAVLPDTAQARKLDSVPVLPGRLASFPYKPKFSVDMIAAGMAYSAMYGYAGQGVILLSDLMGDHQFAFSINLQSSLKENNIFGMYLNSQYRLNYGVGAFYESYYTYADLAYYNLYYDKNFGALGLLRYPFSLFSRIDLNIFYEHSKRDPYLFKNNKLEHNDSLPDISMNITLPSLSYVYDNTLWGITGPIRGIRGEATLLVSPAFTAKDASFFSIDCDLRHYLHINRRFVWANRITCGFSEPIGQEESQRRYFLGGNEYWLFPEINFDKYEKNYTKSNYSSFVVPFRGWDYFDITGTRYIVWNTEFRFPFIKTIQVVWPLPFEIRYINGALFIDMGNAWDPADQYPVIPLPKTIYGGFGFGMRANFGIFVLRYDLAWQTDWRTYVKKHVHHYFSLGAEF